MGTWSLSLLKEQDRIFSLLKMNKMLQGTNYFKMSVYGYLKKLRCGSFSDCIRRSPSMFFLLQNANNWIGADLKNQKTTNFHAIFYNSEYFFSTLVTFSLWLKQYMYSWISTFSTFSLEWGKTEFIESNISWFLPLLIHFPFFTGTLLKAKETDHSKIHRSVP